MDGIFIHSLYSQSDVPQCHKNAGIKIPTFLFICSLRKKVNMIPIIVYIELHALIL